MSAVETEDRLTVCGGCGRRFHLRASFTGPVEGARCFQCCEQLSKASGQDVDEVRTEMDSLQHVAQLPLGWAPSRWAHPRA